ncbi:hypothetical protein Dimus_007942 [Dionaea muscipula]
MMRSIGSFTVGGRWLGFIGPFGVCPSGCSSVTPADLVWEGASDPGFNGAISFFIFFGGILDGGHRSWAPCGRMVSLGLGILGEQVRSDT